MGDYADDAYDMSYAEAEYELDHIDECMAMGLKEDEIGFGVKLSGWEMQGKPFFVYNISEIIHETEKAYLVLMKGGAERWVPKSVCKINLETKEISIQKWFIDSVCDLEHKKWLETSEASDGEG